MKLTFGANIDYFLWSLLTGVSLALIYDLIKLTRRMIKTKDILINLEDILFLFLAGIICVLEAYVVNNGVIRIYSLLTEIAGFVLYRLIVGEKLVDLLFGISNLIVRILIFPIRLIVKPWIKIAENIKKRRREKMAQMPENNELN